MDRAVWVRHGGLCALLAFGWGACGAESTGVEARRQPILGGATDMGDPGVVEFVALVRPGEAAICTAFVVAPRVVLTAGHCIVETAGAPNGVFLGPSNPIVDPRQLLPIETIVVDPGLDNAHTERGHDLAVLVLRAPLAIAPLPLNRAALPGNVVGKTARYVGYGANEGRSKAGTGLKREASAPIASVNEVLLRTGPGMRPICQGDSGGPLLMDLGAGEVVVGVGSFSDDPDCLRSSFFQRLDTQIRWVDAQIAKYDRPDGGVDAGRGIDAGPAARDSAGPVSPDGATDRAESPPDAAAATDPRDGRAEAADTSGGAMTPGTPPAAGPAPARSSGGCSYRPRYAPATPAVLVVVAALALALRRGTSRGRRKRAA